MSQIANHGVIASILATADLPVKRFIGMGGALCAAGAQPAGVSINATKSGQQCARVVSGIAVVEASAGITAGQNVGSAANGKAVAITDAADALKICGVAEETCTADGQFIRVKLR